jgi:hypothetical protein
LGVSTSTYTVSGTAAGPYSGTFPEDGSFGQEPNRFSATFTITSGTTTITGSKTLGPSFNVTCRLDLSSSSVDTSSAPYTATIHTPTGNFHDQGVSTVHVTITGSAATLTESFTSSLTQPVLIVPTSKDQCKDGGWQNFPQFKNQGQCVSFVEHQGK